MSHLPTALNLRPDLQSAIVTSQGLASDAFQRYLTGLGRVLEGMYTVNVLNYGASGNGTFDETEAFNHAVQALVRRGGGNIYIPSGVFKVSSIATQLGSVPIRFIGDGITSVVKRNGDLLPGVGMFDVRGSNVSFENFVIDGDTLTPRGLQYNSGFSTALGLNDPMAPSLSNNTSIWIHGGTENFFFMRMTFLHTAGYALLIDAMDGDINDVDVLNCLFKNNRPTLFGVTPAALDYGSWNGGIFIKGDGRTPTSGVVGDVLVSECKWKRNTGNCLWDHLYGLTRLHHNSRRVGNSFEDCGLDGILVGGVTGGVVANNVFRRVGYVTRTDTDRPVPKWLANVQATALDSSGIVKGVPYVGNSFLNINGGCMDLDGHAYSVIGNNVARVSQPGEPEYDEDDVAISGSSETGATSYGVNIGNTQNTVPGGSHVDIIGNTLLYLSAGAVRLYAARSCLVESNQIVHPDAPIAPPISIGPGGAGANQNATGNIVKHNRFEYSPAAPAPCVKEDDAVAPFVGTDINHIFGNCPIIGNGLATEFSKDPSSGSPAYLETPWFT